MKAERGLKLIDKVIPPPETLPYHPLTALTTVDGRDRKYTEPLVPFLSEYGLQRGRLEVLAEHLIFLSHEGLTPRPITPTERKLLQAVAEDFTIIDAEEIKKIESVENHDVRAALEFFRRKLGESSVSDLLQHAGLGLTSEDITGNALRINITRAVKGVIVPKLRRIEEVLDGKRHADGISPMQGLTHGQAAAPTTAEKEFANFEEWVRPQVDIIEGTKLTGKVNGAVGNWNSLRVVDEDFDWINFSRRFVRSLGLEPRDYTIQINPYDDIVRQLYNFAIVNGILSKISTDMWNYISRGWIKQIPKVGESGSNAMPQKVNPIYFEKAEGKLQEAIDGIHGLGRRFLETRYQRDLRDSTQARDIGSIFGLSLIGYESLLEGFSRIEVDRESMLLSLNSDWTILAEPVQILLRAKTDVEDPYKLLRSLVRGRKMNEHEWRENVVEKLPVSSEVKNKLRSLTPENYLGYAVELSQGIPKEI